MTLDEEYGPMGDEGEDTKPDFWTPKQVENGIHEAMSEEAVIDIQDNHCDHAYMHLAAGYHTCRYCHKTLNRAEYEEYEAGKDDIPYLS